MSTQPRDRNPLDELGVRLAQLETTVSRAGQALRAAGDRITELNAQLRSVEASATALALEIRLWPHEEADAFLTKIDALRDLAKETPWTTST